MSLAKKPNKVSPVPIKKRCRTGVAILGAISVVFGLSVAGVLYYRDWIRARFFTPPYVSIESTEDRTQVYLIEKGEKTQLSAGAENHRDAFRRGDFVVWIEEPQEKSEKYLVRYHIPTNTLLRITDKQVATRPRVSTEGFVVWQGWTEDGWQVFYFDGQQTKQITQKMVVLNPDVAGKLIVFAQKLEDGRWQTVEHNLGTDEQRVVREGIPAKHPYFDGTTLKFGAEP